MIACQKTQTKLELSQNAKKYLQSFLVQIPFSVLDINNREI